MSYATQADLETRFGNKELAKLTDRTAGAVIDTTVINRALADADAMIDGYVAARYQLPLVSVPASLVPVACDIARYNLWGERHTDAIKKRYDDAVRHLRDIASGAFTLVAATPMTKGPGINEVHVSEPSRPLVFNGTRF